MFKEFRVGIAGRALASVQLDNEPLKTSSQSGAPAVLPCPTELATLAPPHALLETKRGTPAMVERAPPRFALFFPLDEPFKTSILAPMLALPGNGGMGNHGGFSVPPS